MPLSYFEYIQERELRAKGCWPPLGAAADPQTTPAEAAWTYDEMDLIRDEGTGPCALCGTEADSRCDDCQCWLCYDHLTIEAQWWDTLAADGVDYRCPDHRRVQWDTRDWLRGRYLPPPGTVPEGTGEQLR